MKNEKLKAETKSSNSWLQRLKDESWEAELLVSAIAIFGTFQLFKVIVWSTNKFIDILPPSQYLIGYFIVFFGLLAVSILVSMFVIHFFLRAYWIGLVGLNSVFPDYSITDSAYSEIYTKKILSILPKLKDSIHKVDELCSVIFSAAFSILLVYSYIALLSSVYLFLYNLLSDYVPYYILLIPAGILAIILILQMVIGLIANLKVNRQKEYIQVLYFKLVKFGSILILGGPLYKSILQVSMIFGSNFKRKKGLIYLIITFLCSGIFIASFQLSNTNLFYFIDQKIYFNETETYAGYYKSENKNIDFLLAPEIASDMIASNTLKIFIPIFAHEKRMRQKTCGTYTKDDAKSREEQRNERRVHNLNCYQKYNQVYLNNKRMTPEFVKYVHPRTKQFGIICYIKLTDALDGKNVLKIKKVYDGEDNSEWTIPFHNILNNIAAE